jgi:hypothetical protein
MVTAFELYGDDGAGGWMLHGAGGHPVDAIRDDALRAERCFSAAAMPVLLHALTVSPRPEAPTLPATG